MIRKVRLCIFDTTDKRKREKKRQRVREKVSMNRECSSTGFSERCLQYGHDVACLCVYLSVYLFATENEKERAREFKTRET